MIFSYLFKRLKRHISEILLSALIVAVIIMLLLGLSYYHQSQQDKLDAVYEDFKIRCNVTNISGVRKIGLDIPHGYLDLLTEESGKLYPYVEDVFLLRELNYATLRPDASTPLSTSVAFYMTNDPEESAYLENVLIQYEESYHTDSFHQNEPICIISSALSPQVSENGTVYLYTPWGETEACVVGTYLSEEEAVFVPWQLWSEYLAESEQTRKATAMAFTISDNRKLSEAKTLLRDYFVPASRTNKSSNMQGLVIDDRLFIDAVVVLERSLALMQVVRVLVYVMSIGVSFLIAFLGIRTRRLELAVMRSMGTRLRALYAEVLWEHFLFFLAGAAVTSPIALLLGMQPTQDNINTIVMFLICYLVGVTLAVLLVTSGQIMQTLKGKE